ncbi:MAG: T9SS type A sorting domain-containing protein [Sphingobacteriales bacterium]|nr:MAG: T9SS type A sorting domain-containing protein [Sphingobacteriales bacterium]
MKKIYLFAIALLSAISNTYGQACSGTPATTTISSSDTTLCTGANFTLTASGTTSATGIDYKWQSRPTGTSVFTDIANSNTAVFTTYASQYTDYRFVSTCVATNETSYSNVLTINATSAPAVGAISETHTGVTYTFVASSITNAETISWDYGDGTTGTNNVHTYTTGGLMQVKFIATNVCTTTVVTLPITVNLPCKTVHIDSIACATQSGICAGTEVTMEPWGHSQGFDIAYQWQSRPIGSTGAFTAVSGQNGAALTMIPDNSADYRLKVTCLSTGTSAMSNVIPMKVFGVPSVVDPLSVTTRAFQDAVFEIQTPGDLVYRWQSQVKEDGPYYYIGDNGTYEGSHTARLTVKSPALSQSGMRFRCIVSDKSGCAFGTDTSGMAMLSVLDPTSVNNKSTAFGISLYPNPATGEQLFIRSSVPQSGTLSAQVMNTMGRTIQKIDITNAGQAAINLAGMAPGVYSIYITDAQGNKAETLSFIRK